MREESIHELGNMAHQRAHSLEGRKGRNVLVSLEMWHVANKDSLARGEEEGGGGSGLVSLEMWHATNEDALCNRPRASSTLVSSGTGQYDETFTLSPSRSCIISFGAPPCTLTTPPYPSSLLVPFLPS